MNVRRMTRLTNAFSKKWENHQAMMALFFGFYNYCRPQVTLTAEVGQETGSALASGLADHPWLVGELLEKIAAPANGAI